METQGSSAFLNQIGLGSFDLGYLVIGGAVLAVLLLVVLILLIAQSIRLKKLRRRLDAFLLGKDGKSLEQDIIGLIEDNKFFNITLDKHTQDIKQIFKRLETVYQKMGLVRYDAFQHMGGQLSFSLAMLDENDNGFIINSIHSTDGCYTYTKEIRNGDDSVSLSAEETEALAIARKK
jgi:tetrahydromethanopterin S-methyltransferase subunit G